MGTLITGPAYGGSTDYFDGDVYDAGDYDSTEELMDDVNESTAEEWADDVSNPEHLIDATGGDLSEEETDALQDVFGSGSSDGSNESTTPDPDQSTDSGSSGPSVPSVPQFLPVPTGGSGGSGVGTTGILLAGAAAVVAIIMGGQ
jgi:hypothetical protein